MFCLLTEEFMLVKHIRSTVFGSASHFCCCFFLVCVGEGELGAGGSVLSTMTGRVTRLHQLFTVRHVLPNKEQWRRRDLGLDTLYRFGA